jgi:ABC-type uncharacterized transport system substrate-binding protein
MRGGDPAKIPFEAVAKTHLILNLPAATAAGLHLPAELIQKAGQVIR